MDGQAEKKYPGLLWKITGNGTKKASYLYGTMHVSNRVAWHLSEEFFSALKSVDVVGLETHPGEWLDNMEKTGELAEISQNPYQNMYRGDFYRTTFNISFPEKRMLQAILSYDPDIINGLLYRQNRSRENFEEDTYIDLFIYQAASKLNKKVIGLEDFAQSQIKARLSALPDQESTRVQSRRKVFSSPDQLEDAYRNGDLDLLDSLNKMHFSNNARKYLLDDRNVFFANTIDSVLQTSTIFGGVGAAHLPGEKGVIELLRKKGYSVEVVKGRTSRKSASIREELDMKKRPLKLSKQFIADSSFSVDLPGKLYAIADIGKLKYYIHPDMINGNFYTVVRLQHAGPVFGMSPASLRARVDSLLFESIPGKIIARKEITSNNGMPGLEIINRTVKGDHQHYQLFFSDTELLMFKIGGKGAFASGRDAQKFFNSIAFRNDQVGRGSFSPATGGFTVSLTRPFSYNRHEGSSLIGLVEELSGYDKGTRQFFGIQHAVYNDFQYLEEDSFELTRFTKQIFENFKFTENKKFTLYAEGSMPAVRFSGRNDQGDVMEGKVIIKGVHYYFVYQITPANGTHSTGFIDSFSLSDFKYINPIREVRDTDFYFSTLDEVTDDAGSRFNHQYMKAYQAILPPKDSTSKNFSYRSGSKLYYSPSSNEYVNINFEKYNIYDYKTPEEIEKRIAENHTNAGLIISNRQLTFKDKKLNYSCDLTDTATSRAIRYQVYFTNGMMHEVTAPFDTSLGQQGWTKTFLESFVPLDTFTTENIFEKKFSRLIADLQSADTTVKNRAERSLPEVGLHKAYAAELISVLGDTGVLSGISEDARAQLFVNGGTLENEKIIEPYSKLYTQYTDSFYLQLSLLKGLAYLQTEKSYRKFFQLLSNEPPLVGESSSLSDVFAVLHDSLELCKSHVQELAGLTRYEEYRDPVYLLLSEMVRKRIISSQLYLKNKKAFSDDALLAAKRYNPAAESGGAASLPDNNAFGDMAGLEHYFKQNNVPSRSAWQNPAIVYNPLQRHPLVSYGILLAPFIKTDKAAGDFFDRLSRIKNHDILLPVTVELLKYNAKLNDTIVHYFSRHPSTRLLFYHVLEENKLEKSFPEQYAGVESMLESLLTEMAAENNRQRKGVGIQDSFQLVAKRSVMNRYEKGGIYIYKNTGSGADKNEWTAFYVSSADGPLAPRIELLERSFYADPQKSQQENISILEDRFVLRNRKRTEYGSDAF